MSDSSKKALGAIVGVVILGGVVSTAIAIFPTASNQGYQPTQPIPYSHRLHAGDLKIDCRYCHVGAEKGRHAAIPSLNVCMNCHRVVKTESPYIKQMKESFDAGKPIEWVRVHELPDFVYFSHRPHVNRGVACQTCHGDIQTMETVYQSQPLTMGWCLDCHRGVTTPPSVSRTMHPDVKDSEALKGLHVAPTNCSTCHF